MALLACHLTHAIGYSSESRHLRLQPCAHWDGDKGPPKLVFYLTHKPVPSTLDSVGCAHNCTRHCTDGQTRRSIHLIRRLIVLFSYRLAMHARDMTQTLRHYLYGSFEAAPIVPLKHGIVNSPTQSHTHAQCTPLGRGEVGRKG